jgi:hypothetical protein
MPVRFLTDAVREQLSGFPAELDSEALDRFFTFATPTWLRSASAMEMGTGSAGRCI